MTSGKCLENEWFYMKYTGKYLSVDIPVSNMKTNIWMVYACV